MRAGSIKARSERSTNRPDTLTRNDCGGDRRDALLRGGRPYIFLNVPLGLRLGELAPQPRNLRIVGLHLPTTWKRLLGIRARLTYPATQHALGNPQILRRLVTETPRSLTNLTASSLNSRLNDRRPIPHLVQHHRSKQGVYETRGSPVRGPHLVGPIDDELAQQVTEDLVVRMRHARVLPVKKWLRFPRSA